MSYASSKGLPKDLSLALARCFANASWLAKGRTSSNLSPHLEKESEALGEGSTRSEKRGPAHTTQTGEKAHSYLFIGARFHAGRELLSSQGTAGFSLPL